VLTTTAVMLLCTDHINCVRNILIII